MLSTSHAGTPSLTSVVAGPFRWRIAALLAGAVVVAAGVLPARATTPSVSPRGVGAASYGAFWDAYAGWQINGVDLAGTFPVNGLASAGVLSSAGCWVYYSDTCTAPLSGRVGARKVSGSCLLARTGGRDINPTNAFFVPPASGGLSLQCVASLGAQSWSLNVSVHALTTGDPTYSPSSQIAPPPFSESFTGRYRATD